jgi:hypothetical protein
MFYTTDPQTRAGFIESLRELADWLAGNPAIPVPKYGEEITLHADSYEDGGKEQVDHIARLFDAPVTDDTPDGHYSACRIFGYIGYEAVSISRAYSARRDAQRSYEDSITLDTYQE